MDTHKAKRGEPGYVSPLKGRRSEHATDEHMARMRALSQAKITRPLADRFWEKVERLGPGDCWEWKGALRGTHPDQQYGQLWNGKKPERAHRISYELHNGPIPDGLVIDHVCRNRKCVNPAHLRAVTPRVNGTENNLSPFATNARKTHCKKGHPLTGENLARFLVKNTRKTRWIAVRGCLTCTPSLHDHPRRFWLPEDIETEQSRGGTPK